MMTLKEAIESLGYTDESIAKALSEKGIKGYRRHLLQSPIAKYLSEMVGYSIVTTISYAIPLAREQNHEQEKFSLPLSHWIIAFDKGEFPEFDISNE